MTGLVLRLDDVVVREAGRTLLDVSELSVAPAETLALIGPNGAGKTTLLHVAALLRRPDSGSVTILGQAASTRNAAALRRALSVVFQDPLLFDVSVLANAAAGLRFQGWSRQDAECGARTWLDYFGVGHLADRKARQLSGGEAARVALARAFAPEPNILLLDEPFSALDAPTRASLLPALRQCLRDTGTAAVLVTHDRDEAFAFGDRVAIVDGGCIVASGEASNLFARPSSRRAAHLLGVENILSGKVTCINGEYASVWLQPNGPSLQSRWLSPSPVALGQIVSLALPAGAVRIRRSAEPPPREWNALPGSIVDVSPLPTGALLTVETPTPIVALSPLQIGSRRWSVGDPVVVAFMPEAAHVISGDE